MGFDGNTLFSAVSAKASTVSLPAGLEYSMALKENAQWKVTFSGSVDIPANIADAEEFAAYKDNIDEIIIKSDITGISAHAFEGMRGLKTVEFEENKNITEIGEAAFKDCTFLSSINLEKCTRLETIGNPDRSSVSRKGTGAFENTALTAITLPASLKTIGNDSFYECYSLVSVNFEEDCQVSYFGVEAFARCEALESINLENCTAAQITFNRADNWSGAFFRCNSLKSVIIPSGASGDISFLFQEARSLRSITFQENTNYINNIASVTQSTSVEVLDLTPLKGMTNIGPWQIRGDTLTKVIIPDTVRSLGLQVMADNPSLNTVEFAPNDYITTIPVEAFRNDRSLISVNLDALSNLTRIDNLAFQNCTSLSSIEIPSKVNLLGNELFLDCGGLIDFKYNAARLTTIGNNIFDGAGKFDFTIGQDVENIPVDFLLQAQNHIVSYKFEGSVTFTVGTEGQSTGLNEPFKNGGKYSADENGNLYLIEGNEAKLIYANREAKELTIPAAVDGYTVTGIGEDAFKSCSLRKLSIDAPGNIKVLEDYAFANAVFLEEINGEKDAEIIKSLFTDSTIGKNIFYNTKIALYSNITGENVFETDAQPQSHDELIVIKRTVDEKEITSLNFVVANANAEIKRETDPDREGMFWTGETAYVSVGGVGDRPVRIYIRADADCVMKLEGSSEIKLEQSDVDGIYYYDLDYSKASSTGIYTIDLSYPDFSATGSKVQVWGVEFDSTNAYNDFLESDKKTSVIYPASPDVDGVYQVTDEYFEIEWTAKPDDFTLTKTPNSYSQPEFIFASDNKITLSNLSYNITFEKIESDRKDNVGHDIIRYVDYTDVLKLPESLSWREGISSSLGTAHFVVKSGGGTMYVTIDGTSYELFTVSGFSNLVSMSVKEVDDGYALCWQVVNPSTTAEIASVPNGSITFGSEVLVAADSVKAGDDIGNIINDLSTDEYFTFSENQTDTAEAVTTAFIAPESKLTIKKERLNKVSKMGEDVQYKITVENPSAFDYNHLDYIDDNFQGQYQGNAIHYIKPENMQLLFDGEDGDYLTIAIKYATLSKKVTQSKDVKTVTGTDVTVSAQETADTADQLHSGLSEEGSVAHKNATITLRKNGDNIELSYEADGINESILIGESEDFRDIASALDSIGYIVTNSSDYNMRWDYPEDYVFAAGTKKEFIINATIKDSLMYLPDVDHNYYYGYPNLIEIPYWNKVDLYSTNGRPTISDDTYDNAHVTYDLHISKGATVRGVNFDEKYLVQDGDVLDYFVNIDHYGTGSYDVLPVVDHMAGLQAVIVRVDENRNAPWADYADTYTDEDGTEYYVLNAKKDPEGYTYNGVYTNGFYADTITVKPSETGLDTILKYYIKNTPGRDCNLSVTYKAISSQALAGNESTGARYYISNEAWLNDRPGHRIYDTILGGGSAVEFDKEIVIEKNNSDPTKDKIDDDDSLPINQNNNVVTYRLSFRNVGSVQIENGKVVKAAPTIAVTGKDIYDMLPLTGSAFDWEKGVNVSLEYRLGNAGYNENGTSAQGGFTYNNKAIGQSQDEEWDISYEAPSKNQTADDKDQQYIVWDDTFKITLPAQATVYIYVTLKFPGMDNDAMWDEFLTEKGKVDALVNTLFVYDLPALVTHTLMDTPKALLQKGVYETGTYIYGNDGKMQNEYHQGKDRWHYSNNVVAADGNPDNNNRTVNTVTYYVVLRNSGKTNLYLAPIYDVLPEGYRYMALRCGNGNMSSWYHVGNNDIEHSHEIPTQHGGWTGVLAMPVDYSADEYNKHFVQATVKYAYNGYPHFTADGRQILKFDLENIAANDKLEKDVNGNYYLAPGQFIQFGYTVYTGDKDITKAVNTVAMQHYDPYNTGETAILDTTTKVRASDYNGKQPNDGDRYLWSSDEAANRGFIKDLIEGDNPSPQWFASDVAVTREHPSPGIKKIVDNPMVSAGSGVNWTVTSYNHGASAISGYTITDTVDAPLKFEGDFLYYLYGPNNKCYAQANHWGFYNKTMDLLFHIKRESKEENGEIKETIKVYPNTLSENEDGIDISDGHEVSLSVGTAWNGYPAYNNNRNAQITVQLLRDEEHETLIIGFPDPKWDIISDGYGKLIFSTSSPHQMTPGPYENTAMFSPYDNEYGKNTQGKLVTDEDGNNLGVESPALVNIYIGSPSASSKMIEEKLDPTNNATSEDPNNNYIVLSGKEKLFTYTLEVHNDDSTGEEAGVMRDLVIIDNLPEVGDGLTMKTERERESEFKVRLADDPNVTVWLNEDYTDDNNQYIKFDPSKYTVQYSNKTGDFNDPDWDGEPTDYWLDSKSDDTRSIRICFIGMSIGPKASIHIKFDAVIDDENAKPGQIAWNNFGYSYKAGMLTAKASPAKVGVCIPGVPVLTKNIVDEDGTELKVSEATTFQFIIYKGDAVDFSDYSVKTVAETLTTAGREFMYTTLTVPEGKSASELLYLEEFKTFSYENGTFTNKGSTAWVPGATYHVVELDTDPDYSFRSADGNIHQNNGSFVFDTDGNTQLVFVNERLKTPWGIKLTKTNETGEPLEGALFGIYTSDESKQMDDDIFNALNIDESFKTIEVDGAVYYLMDAKESPANGVIEWNELDEDVYVVFELKAPDGYYSDGRTYVIKRSDADATTNLFEFTVKNRAELFLPDTGGMGMGLFIEMLGLLFICFAAVFGLRYKHRLS